MSRRSWSRGSILRTFGRIARYDDEPWDHNYIGHNDVGSYYDSMLKAMPDLRIEVQSWRGLRLPTPFAAIAFMVIVSLSGYTALPPVTMIAAAGAKTLDMINQFSLDCAAVPHVV